MSTLLRGIVAGLGQGSIYALIALGFVIIYKSTRIISFAQPALMLAGGLIVALLSGTIGFWAALAAGMVLTAVLGLLIERVTLRPLVGRPVFVLAIITIGLDIAIRVVVNRFIGANPRIVDNPWRGGSSTIAGTNVPHSTIAMVVALALALAVLLAFLKYTRFGLGMRAASLDQETALAQGVNVGRVFGVSWAIAGALAALAGTFVGIIFLGVAQGSWTVALKALPAIIIGGLDSLGGAVVGGLAVGLVEGVLAVYQATPIPGTELTLNSVLGSNFSAVSPYLLLILVLLVRPYGLFGTKEVERV